MNDLAGLAIAPDDLQALRQRLERDDNAARQPTMAARDEILAFFARRLSAQA